MYNLLALVGGHMKLYYFQRPSMIKMALLVVFQCVVSFIAKHSTKTYSTLTAPELCLSMAFRACAIWTDNTIWTFVCVAEPVSFNEPLSHFSLLPWRPSSFFAFLFGEALKPRCYNVFSGLQWFVWTRTTTCVNDVRIDHTDASNQCGPHQKCSCTISWICVETSGSDVSTPPIKEL